MKISTKGRYALRVMIDIAQNSKGEYMSLKDIAARQQISMKYLEAIIGILNRAGYVTSLRGKSGGYKLTKHPKDYTVGSILRLTEGSLSPVACLDADPVTCERADNCITLPFWKGLKKVIDDYIDGYTLEDFINQEKNLIGNDYSI